MPDGLLAGAAEAVDRQAGRGERPAGAEHGQAGDVGAVVTDAAGVAGDDVLDLRRVDAGPLHDRVAGTAASSSCGWTWCRAPFCLPLPRGVRTPSMIQASRSLMVRSLHVFGSSGGSIANHLQRHDDASRPSLPDLASHVDGRTGGARATRRDGVVEHPSPHRAHRHPAQRGGSPPRRRAAAGARRPHGHRRRAGPHEPAASGPATRASWPGSAGGPQIEADLVEWDYGVAEGKRTDEMRDADPGVVGVETTRSWAANPSKRSAPGRQVLARIAGEDRLVVRSPTPTSCGS